MRRYGRNFDCGSMAVSVAHGGLVNKGMLGFRHTDHGDRIVTIDPLTSECLLVSLQLGVAHCPLRKGRVVDMYGRPLLTRRGSAIAR